MKEHFLKEQFNIGGKLFGSLQEAYDMLWAVVNNSHDGIFITDGDANVLWVNPAYLAISGLSIEAVDGKNMYDLKQNHTIDVSGTLLAIEHRKAVNLEQHFKTGKIAFITSTPCFNERNDILMVVTNVRDMTEYYQLQEKYQETQEKYDREKEFERWKICSSADITAVDEATIAVLRQVNRVAALDTTVLLRGETGVGKENFAKHIYNQSPRREMPFFSINCGAIPESLIESELFGYEKGAFTGATGTKMGIFELADQGTLFLDEVGDLPKEVQVKLLRVLQEHKVRRIGGTKDIDFDIRVLAATNRNLEEMVKNDTFRQDPFYRLNVVPINIPPLRERKKDIIPLAEVFLEELNRKYGFCKSLAKSAEQELLLYAWPGNVRELKNIVERVVILSHGEKIHADDLPFSAERHSRQIAIPSDEPLDLKIEVLKFEHAYLEEAFAKHGNVRGAARSLGIDAATFVRKRQRYQETVARMQQDANMQQRKK